MESTIVLAFNTLTTAAAAGTPLFDPVDHVVETHPLLANRGFTAYNPVGAAPFISCADSALMLARAAHWEDEKKKKETLPPLEPFKCAFLGGATVLQMERQLWRYGMRDFPVYEYNDDEDDDAILFELIGGKPRKDEQAILFIPAHAMGGGVAHWTFGQIVHEDSLPVWPVRVEYVVVYTSAIITDTLAYWRAEVNPQNIRQYEAAKSIGRACDCSWDLQCRHEVDWLNNRHGLGMPTMRVSLDGGRHVLGTRYGIITGATDKNVALRRVGESGLRITTRNGHSQEFKYMVEDLSVLVNARITGPTRWAANNDIVTTHDRTDTVIHPYSVIIKDFEDEDELVKLSPRRGARRTFQYFNGLLLNAMSNHDMIDISTNVVTDLHVLEPTFDWASDVDLKLKFPRKHELLARLALRTELNETNVLDTLRQMCAQENWSVSVTRDEVQTWVKRVVTSVGKMILIRPIEAPRGNVCWNCFVAKKTKYHMCRECRKVAMSVAPEPLLIMDSMVTYVGYRPIWSSDFKLPEMELKKDVLIEDLYLKKYLYRKDDYMTVPQLIANFRKHMGDLSCRGYLRGPMYLGMEPKCFPRGCGTAALAFLVRLGAKRVHQAQTWFFDLCYEWLLSRHKLMQVDPESWELFISHFSGEKRRKNEEARQEELDGWAPQLKKGELYVGMKGFAKAEKSYNFKYEPVPILKYKTEEKPRFICSPAPMILSRLGRWTHAQTKWLAHEFTCNDHLYYAGCSKPEELHSWLNMTLGQIPDPYTLVDDITAMDSNHSPESFAFHARIREHQFPYISAWIHAAYKGEEQIKVRVGNFSMEVNSVNASGVSDTSYKNSMLCLPVRLLALVHAYLDITHMSEHNVLKKMTEVEQQIYMSVSGDDGLVRLPDMVSGVKTLDFSMERYKEAWAWSGFDIKVDLIPPNRWRMATFLAMRPVWAGNRYEWAPEPARRMRGMFWQLDNTCHPTAWARGIAIQVRQQSRALPVLRDICDWFLANTSGPAIAADTSCSATNIYSPFYGSEMSGDINERSISEFCLDYRVDVGDYERFKKMLSSTTAVLVNLDAFILHRIFAEES